MGYLIGLIELIILVWVFSWHWYVGLLLVAAIAIYVIYDNKQSKRKQKEIDAQQEADKEAARKQHHQEFDHDMMIVLGNQALTWFESMPDYLASAEKYLDQAEIDFADGAFAPFWDSIEAAVKDISQFDEWADDINENSSKYCTLIAEYEGPPPPFPLTPRSIAKLEVGKAIAERMQAIVRKAQSNFEFATIYEQHKTNQILVAGFTNLAQALDEMSWRITNSTDTLMSSIEEMTSMREKSMRGIHSRMDNVAEEISKEGSERRAREEKVIEMLDNIQRRRRPFP